MEEINKLDARASKIERDYMKAVDRDDDEGRSERLGALFARVSKERKEAMLVTQQCRAALVVLDSRAVDARMSETVRRLSDRDVVAINDALHVEFERFVIDPDTGDVTPEWRPPETEFDLGTALDKYRASQEGGGSGETYPEPC